jgi:pimeloyl-ACP methyl ester carboxylesterase/DNA-binding CsgD family transcriptional regulator
MNSGVRYCIAEDGVRIAYYIDGAGPPLLLTYHFYATRLSHLVPHYDDAIRRLARKYSVIRFDVRGTGVSTQNVRDMSFEALMRDVDAVVRGLELECFYLMGAAMGGIRAVEYAARHPDRVAGLVLYDACPTMENAFPATLLEAFAKLSRADWQLATLTMTDAGIRRSNQELGMQWAKMWQNSVSGETMARIIESHIRLDVTDLLPQIRCPTLVCHSQRDPLYPYVEAQRMADLIPNSRLITMDYEGGSFTEPGPVIEAMEQFLPELPPLPALTTPGAPSPVLSPRETEILRLLATGATSKEISRELDLSVRTVGRHITNIYDKIGARGRADATAYALRHGIT